MVAGQPQTMRSVLGARRRGGRPGCAAAGLPLGGGRGATQLEAREERRQHHRPEARPHRWVVGAAATVLSHCVRRCFLHVLR